MSRRKKNKAGAPHRPAALPIGAKRSPTSMNFMIVAAIMVLLAGSAIGRFAFPSYFLGAKSKTLREVKRAEPARAPALKENDETPEQALARIQKARLIVNDHEHMQNEGCTADWFKVMEENGFAKTLLMGSSMFTLTMQEKYGFTGYDANNDELIKIANKWPDKFEAWPALNPIDPAILEKCKDLHERGAKGYKLYSGHGYIRRDNGNYMFHSVALDDPAMLPVYEYCQKNYLPLCLHVNPFLEGFAQEMVAVLTQYPDLKIIAPHFILSSINETRLREYLDTFPNLYSDVSFGHDDFLKAGMERISKFPDRFKKLFADYPNRFLFGTDLVLTDYEAKSPSWCKVRIQAYFDMLTRESYTSELFPGKTLRGAGLRGPLLDNILYRNYEQFSALKPSGTKITRAIDWSRMGVKKVERTPGQSFPPKPRATK